jgi:hypothetical protein
MAMGIWDTVSFMGDILFSFPLTRKEDGKMSGYWPNGLYDHWLLTETQNWQKVYFSVNDNGVDKYSIDFVASEKSKQVRYSNWEVDKCMSHDICSRKQKLNEKNRFSSHISIR